jgi:hypothetical protein
MTVLKQIMPILRNCGFSGIIKECSGMKERGEPG